MSPEIGNGNNGHPLEGYTRHVMGGMGKLNGVKDPGMDKAVFNEYVANVMLNRQNFFHKLLDPRRDINAECGYKQTGELTADIYKDLYDRESIATRVVELFPKECWQLQPTVYEDEDAQVQTEFEMAWDNLHKKLRGDSWYQDEEGSPIWEILKRLDIVSGIGHFGILLLGISDGKALREPIKGFEDDPQQGTAQQYYVYNQELGTFVPVSNSPESENPLDELDDEEETDDEDMEDDEEPTDEQDDIEEADDEDVISDENEEDGDEEVEETASGKKVKGREEGEFKGKVDLLYLRCYDESLVMVTQFETRKDHPRFGLPKMYQITINDPSDVGGIMNVPQSTVDVHWSRIIHVADNLNNSEIIGVPRMRAVYNRLYDLVKLYGGSAEMYWRGAFPGLAFSTHPQLGGDVTIDAESMKEQMENYSHTLQRYLTLEGMSVNTISPTVVDPSMQIDTQITAICVMIGVPKRIFMGSERGELASGQDDGTWNSRVHERQVNYITPRIIIPFIDRLIKIGVLPEPQGYSVAWPDLDSATPLDLANIASVRTAAIAQYIQGSVEAMIAPRDFLVRILGMDEYEAQEILEATQEHLEEVNPDSEEDIVAGHLPAPPAPDNPFAMGPDGKPIDPNDPNAQKMMEEGVEEGAPEEISEDDGELDEGKANLPPGIKQVPTKNSSVWNNDNDWETQPRDTSGRFGSRGGNTVRAQRTSRAKAARDAGSRGESLPGDPPGSRRNSRGQLIDAQGHFIKTSDVAKAAMVSVYSKHPELLPEKFHKPDDDNNPNTIKLDKKYFDKELERASRVGAYHLTDTMVNEIGKNIDEAVEYAAGRMSGKIEKDKRPKIQVVKEKMKRAAAESVRVAGVVTKESAKFTAKLLIEKALGHALERTFNLPQGSVGRVPLPKNTFTGSSAYDVEDDDGSDVAIPEPTPKEKKAAEKRQKEREYKQLMKDHEKRQKEAQERYKGGYWTGNAEGEEDINDEELVLSEDASAELGDYMLDMMRQPKDEEDETNNYRKDQKRDEEGQWTVEGAVEAVKEKLSDAVTSGSTTRKALGRAIGKINKIFKPAAAAMTDMGVMNERVSPEVEHQSEIIFEMIMDEIIANYSPDQKRDQAGKFAEMGRDGNSRPGGSNPSADVVGPNSPRASSKWKGRLARTEGIATGFTYSLVADTLGERIGSSTGAIVGGAIGAIAFRNPAAMWKGAKWGSNVGRVFGSVAGSMLGYEAAKRATLTHTKETSQGIEMGFMASGFASWGRWMSKKWGGRLLKKFGKKSTAVGETINWFDPKQYKSAQDKAQDAYRKAQMNPNRQTKEAYRSAKETFSEFERKWGGIGPEAAARKAAMQSDAWIKANEALSGARKAAKLARSMKTGEMEAAEVQKILRTMTAKERKVFTNLVVRGQKK